MRIIAGSLKGRVIPPAVKGQVRPTSDRVRESLFSTLGSFAEDEGPSFAGWSVLDLFAGSGSLGLESISRGAEDCVFVEKHPQVAQRLEKLIGELGISEQADVVRSSAAAYLKREGGATFDLVFLDPPYGQFEPLELLRSLCCSGVLQPCTWVVYETAKNILMPDEKPCIEFDGSSLSLELERAKSFGDTVISYFRCKPRTEHE